MRPYAKESAAATRFASWSRSDKRRMRRSYRVQRDQAARRYERAAARTAARQALAREERISRTPPPQVADYVRWLIERGVVNVEES